MAFRGVIKPVQRNNCEMGQGGGPPRSQGVKDFPLHGNVSDQEILNQREGKHTCQSSLKLFFSLNLHCGAPQGPCQVTLRIYEEIILTTKQNGQKNNIRFSRLASKLNVRMLFTLGTTLRFSPSMFVCWGELN